MPNAAGNPVPMTIRLTDAGGLSSTANLNLAFNVAIANACAGTATGNESVLAANSQYAFFLQGFRGPGAGAGVALAGSIGTDGEGHVTGGEEDLNTPTGPQHLTIIPAASSYTVGSDNRGCLMLTYSGQTNTTAVFHFAVGGVNAGVASRGRIIEFDDDSGTDAGTRGSGIIRLQDKTAFSLSSLQKRYAFGMDGMNSTGAHVALGGAFNVDTLGNIFNGFLDIDDGGQLQSAVSGATGLISTTSSTATTGRETVTYGWVAVGQIHAMSSAIYVVNANEFFIIQIDQLAVGKPIASGRAIVTGSSSSVSSLSGNYILHDSGSTAGRADVTLGLLNFTSGSVNGSLVKYTSADGLQTTPIVGGNYMVDATTSGRVTVSGFGPNPPVLYLTVPTADTETISAFVVGTDTSAGFGFLEVQPTVTYSAGTLSGNFVIGTEDPNDNLGMSMVGAVSVTNVPIPGLHTAIQDSNNAGGRLQTDLVNPQFLAINSNGAGGFVGNSVFLLTNGTKIFYIQAEPGAAAFIVVVEQ
jgi:hypothetical protein